MRPLLLSDNPAVFHIRLLVWCSLGERPYCSPNPMPKSILVRGARQLLTLRGPCGPRRWAALRNLGIIQDGALLVVDGVIREIGPTCRIENLALARDAVEIDASGAVVMPGFVDCNTHLAAGPARLAGYEMRLAGRSCREIAEAGGGVLGLARSIQDLSFRALEASALRVLDESVRHGTTTIETRSGFGLTTAGEMKMLRVHSALQKRRAPLPIVSTFLCGRPAPGSDVPRDDQLPSMCSRLLPLVKRRKRAEFAAVRCASDGFPSEQARLFLASARKLGFPLRVETDGTAASSAISLALEFDATSVDHVPNPTAQDIARLAGSSTIATLTPGRTFHLRTQKYPPARDMIDQGVAVALATGFNPETSPSENMQMALALACTAMRMTPAEAITAATINAAYALRRDATVGSLEAGKSANLLVLRVSDYREIPYHFGVNLVDLVMVNGDILVRRPEVPWPAN